MKNETKMKALGQFENLTFNGEIVLVWGGEYIMTRMHAHRVR